MTAKRESMTLQQMDAPALGVEERSDETPKSCAAGTGPGGRGQANATPIHRRISTASP